MFGEDANEKKRKHENGDQNEDETEAKKTRQVDVTLADPVPTIDTIGNKAKRVKSLKRVELLNAGRIESIRGVQIGTKGC